MIEEMERVTKLIKTWSFNGRHFSLKASEWIYWYWPYVETLTIINVILNKRLTLQKIDDEFTDDEIKNVIINFNLFMLEIKNERVL